MRTKSVVAWKINRIKQLEGKENHYFWPIENETVTINGVIEWINQK
jgi:hypothetical protein